MVEQEQVLALARHIDRYKNEQYWSVIDFYVHLFSGLVGRLGYA
jgi:hypothetical protein